MSRISSTVVEPLRAERNRGYSGVASHQIDWRNPSDDSVIAFIASQVRYHDERHYWWVRRAKLQLAWAAGDQLKVWDDHTRALVDSFDVQSDRIALYVNRIKPAILNWISLITARPISFRVHPATSDDIDIASARVQDKLARYYWRKLLGDDVFIDALWMMFCTGCAFFRSTWDSFAGDEFDVVARDVMNNEEIGSDDTDEHGIRSKFRKLITKLSGESEDNLDLEGDERLVLNQGDIKCDFLDGFSICPPYRATNIKTTPWLITRQYRHLEDLKARYGKLADKLNPTFQEPFFTYQDYEGLESWHEYYGHGVRTPDQSADHVLVYELWRPKNRHKKDKGNHIITAQNVVLKNGENPYEHGEIPIVMIQELPSPKKFWPPSTVQDLMGLQAEINVSRSQVAEHKAATIEPRIIAEKGAGLDDMAFTERNEIVEVNPGKIDKIRPWVPEPLPQYLVYWEQSLRRDFEDVSRNHAPSYGKQTGSIKSGRHAVALQEADMRMNSPMFRLMRDSLGQMCRQWMAMLKQFVNEERVTTIIGENNEPEVLRWSSHVMAQSEFNVECDLGTPMDRQTTVELIDMMTARGWLQPGVPEDREMVRRWLGQGVTQEADESHQDRSNADLENQMMLRGQLPSASDGDDDTIHIYEHEREQKTARYRRAVAADPDIERVFLIHKTQHERQRVQKKIRQQIYAQEITREMMGQAGLTPQVSPRGPGGPGRTPPGRPQPPPGQTVRPSGGQPGSPAQTAPLAGRRASSRPPPAGFRRSNTGEIFVPR